MTTTDPFFAPGSSGPPIRGQADDRPDGVLRDRWDRYLMPLEDGTQPGPQQGRLRASTLKSMHSDTTGIRNWEQRLVVQGLAQNPDLLQRAIELAQDPDANKSGLLDIAREAFKRGGGKDRSNLGTDVHLHHERTARGEVSQVPEQFQRDTQAYDQALKQYGVQVLPEYLERVVRLPYGAAGKIDNIVRWFDPDTQEWELVVMDLKTGRDLSYGWLEILLQLWQYANMEAFWVIDPEPDMTAGPAGTGHFEPRPGGLRRDKALVIHTPMNGTAELFVLDLGGVREWVEAAVTGRRAGKEAPRKVHSLGVVDLRGPAYVTPDAPVGVDFTKVRNPTAETVATMFGGEPGEQLRTPDSYMTPAGPVTADPEQPNHRQATVTPVGKPGEPPKPEQSEGRKKRACSVCRQPGHTAKNCPQNPDSPKYQRATVTPIRPDSDIDYRPADAGGPEINQMSSTELADVAVVDNQINRLQELIDAATAPYCEEPHGGGWTNSGTEWVCPTHGKPARLVWEQNQSTAAVPAVAAVDQSDPIHYGILQAASQEGLTNFRSRWVDTGHWTKEHEEHAAKRWAELTPLPW